MGDAMGMPLNLNTVHNNVIRDVRDAKGALTRQTFRSITLNLPCRFPYNELTKLYRMIETSIPEKNRRVVQFLSAYTEEGASEVALETAIAVARLIGLRVLFIDTSATLANRMRRQLVHTSIKSLDALVVNGGSPYEAIAQLAGTELYFAMLCGRADDGLSSVPMNAIENALESLRLNFDLILVDSQGIMNDAFGMALAKLVDGSVMVIEAERTRAPVASECKRILEECGGRLLGAVMNRRRLHIPHYLYNLLYQRLPI